MKRLVIGILAHVDSGKTTLSEAILYRAGELRKLGRVDRGDSFLDNNDIERDRGITIFSKQALVSLGEDVSFTLIDTPGHADFSAETERTLSVLDYVIMVVSGTDGIQSHTETLWKLVREYNIPTFVFVNKMDISTFSQDYLMENIISRLGDGCVSFSDYGSESFFEEISMRDEDVMHRYFSDGRIEASDIAASVAACRIFPCFFGSALKLDGIDELLGAVRDITVSLPDRKKFGAKVYKISEDERGTRLTHMKITGGSLDVKTVLSGESEGESWEEKINEIRVYSGGKFSRVNSACQGTVCAVAGLSRTYAGEGLGFESDSAPLTLEPVFSYRVRLPEGVSDSEALMTLKRLNDEETQLNVYWDARLREIRVRLMGEIQTEVLKRIIAERFGMQVELEQGGIIYKETIENTVEGVGHYEPLRHYAEVHLILEPAKRGSGINFMSKCREDELDINWQRLIMTHLKEKTHIGVLTGSLVTDMNIILVSGRAHKKHTEGGDFRQATYRAVRQGLRNAKSILLEPWYSFRAEVPEENIGRVMSDIQRMGGNFEPPENSDGVCTLCGKAPVEKLGGYHSRLISFTGGRGRMLCSFCGYEPCDNADEVIASIDYSCDADVDNTADSVFCSHGTSVVVKWDEVYEHMHIESALKPKTEASFSGDRPQKKFDPKSVSDDELMRIFEKTFGKPKQKSREAKLKTAQSSEAKKPRRTISWDGPEYLLVDGYNIIFAWESLSKLAKESMDLARTQLVNRLVNYRAVRGCEVIVVFDAYKVKNNPGSVESINDVSIVYTKEAETADTYIEKVSHELSKNHFVRVATSDGAEQMIIIGNGAVRISASAFEKELAAVEKAIEEYIREN